MNETLKDCSAYSVRGEAFISPQNGTIIPKRAVSENKWKTLYETLCVAVS